MNGREELEQRIWEFVYELLPDDDAASVAELITSDPDAARLYADTKLQQGLLAEASQLARPPISLVPPVDDVVGLYEETERNIQLCRAAGRPRSFAASVTQWAISAAAAALIGMMVFSYTNPDSPVRQIALQNGEQAIADQPVYATLVGPERLQPASANYFTVMTRSADGEPAAADLSYTLYDPNDQVLYRNTVQTDSSGLAQLQTPESLAADEVRLEVAIEGKVAIPAVRARLPVDDVQLTTHLSLDKSWYRPGETVRFRSLTLSRFSLNVLREVDVEFEMLTPRGELLSSTASQQGTEQGVASGQYDIPAHLHGGKYTLVARSLDRDFEPTTRDFYIRDYQTSELVTDLEFLRDSYGPGDQVAADFSVRWADGRPAGNASLEAVAIIDGQTSLNLHTVTRPDGTYRVRFALPERLENGDGVLAMKVSGESVGTAARSIPIQVDDFQLDFYPESGDLAPDLPNRVYFHAHTPQGRPVHIAGRVIDGDGETVLSTATVHEGRGLFAFTPRSDEAYRFEIDSPANVADAVFLPPVRPEQEIVINTGPGVFDAGRPAELEIYAKNSDTARPLSVMASCRGVVVGQQVVDQAQPVTLAMDERAQGVIRVTAYDLSSDPPWPLAERLIYRRPLRYLNVDLADASEAYSPGQEVNLGLAVRDELGRPQPAALGVSVVDRSLLEAVDSNSKTPRMTTHFWLTAEIKDAEDLEDANFYLESGDDAAEALDLLLGTQGWRRFVATPRGRLAEAGFNPWDVSGAVEGDVALTKPVGAVDAGSPKLLAHNREPAHEAVKRAVTDLYAARQIGLRRLGVVLFAGAVVIVFVLIAAGLFRMLQDARFWLPALGAAAVCLIVGGVWMTVAVENVSSVAWLQQRPNEPTVRMAQARIESRAVSDAEMPAASEGIEKDGVLDDAIEAPIADRLAGASVSERNDTAETIESSPAAESPLSELDAIAKPPVAGDAARGMGGVGGMGGGGMGGGSMGTAGGMGGGVRQPAFSENQPTMETPAIELMVETPQAEPRQALMDGPSQGYGGAARPLAAQPKSGDAQPEMADLIEPVRPSPASMMAPADPAPAVSPAARQRLKKAETVEQRRGGAHKIEADADGETDGEPTAEQQPGRGRRSTALAPGAIQPASEDEPAEVPAVAGRVQSRNPVPTKAESLYFSEQRERQLALRDLKRGEQAVLPVREYASMSRQQDSDSIRSYFGDSVFWDPRLPTTENGRAEIQFVLSDTATTFEVLADAHAEGRIGSGGGPIVSRMPFRLDPLLPMELGAGDVIEVPVAVVNGTAEPLVVNVNLETDRGLKLAEQSSRDIQLEANQRSHAYFPLTATDRSGMTVLTCNGATGSLRDSVRRSILVEPTGYPIQRSYAGYISEQETIEIPLPEDLEIRSVTASVVVFPSPVSQLMKGLESLANSRGLGLDATARAHYGDLFARPYIQQNGIADPAVTRQMKRLLGGTDRHLLAQWDALASDDHYDDREFQTGWGYSESFTRDLLERSVQPDDPRSSRSDVLDGLSSTEANAFGLWARRESGQSIASRESKLMIESAKDSTDPYLIALAVLAVGKQRGEQLAKRLLDLQQADGSFIGRDDDRDRTSRIEATALAVLALLEQSSEDEAVDRAVVWLNRNRQTSGGFGTPVATSLALKGLLEYEQSHPTTRLGQDTLVLTTNGRETHRQTFAAAHSQPIVLDNVAPALAPGDNTIQLSASHTKRLPYVLGVEYHAAKPENCSDCPLRLQTALSEAKVARGDVVSVKVRVSNTSEQPQPTAAVIGLPAGLSPRIEQLDELQEKGRCDYYEIDGRRLIFYWRQLDTKDDGRQFTLELIAEIPGRFTGPPSQIYRTTAPSQSRWCEPLTVQIAR